MCTLSQNNGRLRWCAYDTNHTCTCMNCGKRIEVKVIFAVVKKAQKKFWGFNWIWTGMTFAIPVRCSTNWAMKPRWKQVGSRSIYTPTLMFLYSVHCPCFVLAALSENVAWYHNTKSIAGCINSFKDLNQQKTSILSSPISWYPKSSVKLWLCFTWRIENNKVKKIKKKSKCIQQMHHSDRISERVGTSIYKHISKVFGMRSWCSHVSELHSIWRERDDVYMI